MNNSYKEMKAKMIYPNSIRVFYNQDCGKYGVEIFDHGTSSGQLGWRQVDTTTVGATDVYTPYKKVAERWRENFIAYGEAVK